MAFVRRGWPLLLAVPVLLAALAAARPAPPRGPERVLFPDPDAGVLSLAERKKAQLAAVAEF